ncbi:MAG: hypothetical protein EXS16_21955 [Gemmataceae bacterium]|nr:hypothetical protein [Gemmataceae bacterium]
MIVKKAHKKPTKPLRTRNALPSDDWRASLRRRLGKVAGIDAVFAATSGLVIHIFSVMAEHESSTYDPLMRQEEQVEADHPGLAFDFHTRVHQGRPPQDSVPHGTELILIK